MGPAPPPPPPPPPPTSNAPSTQPPAPRGGRGGWAAARLCHHDDLPIWANDNDFIQRGYRRPGGCALDRAKDRLDRAKNHRHGPPDADEGEARRRKATTTNGSGHGPAPKADPTASARRRRKDTPATAAEAEPAARVASAGRNATHYQSIHDHEAEDDVAYHEEGRLPEHDSFRKCVESIFLYWHNETVNIHTHMWGALVVLVFALLHLASHFDALPDWCRRFTHHAMFRSPALELPGSFTRRMLPRLPFITSANAASSSFTSPRALARAGKYAKGSRVSSFSLLSSLDHVHAHDWHDVVGFSAFLVAALCCLCFSSTFHAFQCHSRTTAHRCNKLDYVGIVVMIVGSFLPALRYGFYCHAHLQLLYAASIVALGALAMYTVVAPRYSTPAYRPVRTAVFLALGLSATVPVAHLVRLYGWHVTSSVLGFDRVALSGALYVVGATLYAARVPERFAPGRFDYVGASHQLFHLLILAAAWTHYVGLRRAYHFWHAVEVVGSVGGGGGGGGGGLATRLVGSAATAWFGRGGGGGGAGAAGPGALVRGAGVAAEHLLVGVHGPAQAAVCQVLAGLGRHQRQA